MPNPFPPRLSPFFRSATACVALLALAGLGAQFIAEKHEMDGASNARVIWALLRYFTITTNILVVAIFGMAAYRGEWRSATWPAAVTVWIIIVGVVYHALLASTNTSVGIGVWANVTSHTLVPILVPLLWGLSAPKAPLPGFAPLIWTLYPMGYAIYAILRGLVEGRYPYFFLDPARSGWPLVSGYVLGLGALFVLSGYAILLIARLLRPKTTPREIS